MNDERILEKVEGLARRHLGVTAALRPEVRLVEDLGLDSFRMLALAVEVENGFEICLSEEAEAEIVTVGDLVAVIRRQLEEGESAPSDA
jgi:acyl carrier protein